MSRDRTSRRLFFGMLQSAPHISWTLEKGSTLEDRPRYNFEITFETFPFP